MSRTSSNQLTADGILLNGYDYNNQAWVINGVYMDCGHPQEGEALPARHDSFWQGGKEIKIVIEASVFDGCNCYGRAHKGEPCTVRGSGNFHHHDCDEQNIEYYGPLCSTLCGLAPKVLA